MKKIFYLFAAVLLFASCEKEEIGSTATESMSGQWYVHVDAIKDNGEILEVIYRKDANGQYELDGNGNKIVEFKGEDPYNYGNFRVLTYNVSDNSSDVMLIDDLENLWTFRTKVDCDLSSFTFSASEPDKYVYATEYDGTDVYTYNNFYYKAGSFDAEKWQWYKEGEAQYKAGAIKKDSLDKMLEEYNDFADDTASAGYYVKYAGREFEVGLKKGDPDVENACNITITDGKIMKGAATTPSGMPADSIVFYVEFDDDYSENRITGDYECKVGG